MNYEEMSDYKINRKVLWLTRGENVVAYKDRKSPDGVLCHGMQGVFDPCNNPSDAWPIIVENKISIGSSSDAWISGSRIFGTQVLDKNPLRAAMICFLKMKDAEK